MGLILDTSVLINAERQRLTVIQMLDGLGRYRSEEFALSSVSLMELAHGVVRARTPSIRLIRAKYLDDLRSVVPTIPLDDEIAIRAGEINATLRHSGVTIGVADAMIAATAVANGYAVATSNVKHFRMISGLEVVEL